MANLANTCQILRRDFSKVIQRMLPLRVKTRTWEINSVILKGNFATRLKWLRRLNRKRRRSRIILNCKRSSLRRRISKLRNWTSNWKPISSRRIKLIHYWMGLSRIMMMCLRSTGRRKTRWKDRSKYGNRMKRNYWKKGTEWLQRLENCKNILRNLQQRRPRFNHSNKKSFSN